MNFIQSSWHSNAEILEKRVVSWAKNKSRYLLPEQMPGWRRCCSKRHFNRPRGESEPGRFNSPGGQRYRWGWGEGGFLSLQGAALRPPPPSLFWSATGLVPAACSEELFSTTAEICNSILHCKQWRRRLPRTARNSGEAARRLTFHSRRASRRSRSHPPREQTPKAGRPGGRWESWRGGRLSHRRPRAAGGGIPSRPGTARRALPSGERSVGEPRHPGRALGDPQGAEGCGEGVGGPGFDRAPPGGGLGVSEPQAGLRWPLSPSPVGATRGGEVQAGQRGRVTGEKRRAS